MSDANYFPYLHGFSESEQQRLREQAFYEEHRIYQDIDFSRIKNLLEVGCGVGAQSEILLRRFSKLHLTGIDLNDRQLASAKEYLATLPYAKDRYEIKKMDAQNLEFESNSFEGAFLCWVLEHIPHPQKVLNEVRRVLRPGSKVFITEVLNSTFFLDPYSPNVWKYWMAFNDYQLDTHGDPFIGAKLGNLLQAGGFQDIKLSLKNLHFDNRFPDERKETIDFWTDLLMSAKEQLISEKVITQELADAAYQELKTIASDPNAVFYYTYVQAQATVI
ncbi:MAG: SAM-dependent methyltransferase [Halobacteriovoraceae bacterium]|nr:SAM-dependent methyltransferase [Halobacteriovoraceae bacterium]|tara:strand:+ start:9168 stop:9992 length:825 start_codon:yes stop_codon:yes gene_type:complete